MIPAAPKKPPSSLAGTTPRGGTSFQKVVRFKLRGAQPDCDGCSIRRCVVATDWPWALKAFPRPGRGSDPVATGDRERMQNANLSQETSEDQGSRIPDMPPQRSAEPGLRSASIIERAAQRLDWTIAFGVRQSTPRGLGETTNQQPRPDPSRIARASRLRSSRAGGPRLLLTSRLCLASVVVAAIAGTGIFLLMHSAGEKASAEKALATEAPAKSLIRGMAVMPPDASTAQTATLAGPAPTAAASDWEGQLSLGPPPSSPGGPQPKVATIPAAKTPEATSTFASPAPQNQPTVPAFSGAEIAGLLARGEWLFATGDVASARLLYERAANAGEARAAMRLGQTFDPVYLDHSHLRGLRGDPGTAVFWYRRARDLGATGVASRLERLETNEGRN